MTRLVLIELLLFVNSAIAQTTTTDSIDYSFMLDKKVHRLIKVKTGDDKETVYHNELVFYTWRVEKTEDIQPMWATTIKIGDTLMWTDWDYDKGNQPIGVHSCGKINLNQTTNMLTLEKYIWGQKETIIRKFKVIRWEKEKIVLQDHSNIYLRRLYFFEE